MISNAFSAFPWHYLTHWGRVTHICICILTIIGSDNGLAPGRHKAIIWTNAGMLLIGPLGTNSEILIRIQTFSFKKMHLTISSAKLGPFCLGLNVLKWLISWDFTSSKELEIWNMYPWDKCLWNFLFVHMIAIAWADKIGSGYFGFGLPLLQIPWGLQK